MLLDLEEEETTSTDVLTLLNQAVSSLGSLVNNASFRFTQPPKILAAFDSTWAALSAAQTLERSKQSSNGPNQEVLDRLAEIKSKVDKLEQRFTTRSVVAKKLPILNLIKQKKSSIDPLPGTH